MLGLVSRTQAVPHILNCIGMGEIEGVQLGEYWYKESGRGTLEMWQENHMVKNCITNMPEDVKWKVIDHTNLADTNSNQVALGDKLFTSISISFGSRKWGKLKPRWEEDFAWSYIHFNYYFICTFVSLQGVTRLKGVC